MTSQVPVSLDFATQEKIDFYVDRGRFDSAQELIEAAVRQFLYELSLEDTEWPRKTDISQAEMEDELDDIRRVHRSRPGDDPGIQ
jgi:Arc/MetJ-type ribon-helix-helix transcriptional regulator